MIPRRGDDIYELGRNDIETARRVILTPFNSLGRSPTDSSIQRTSYSSLPFENYTDTIDC